MNIIEFVNCCDLVKLHLDSLKATVVQNWYTLTDKELEVTRLTLMDILNEVKGTEIFVDKSYF